MAPLPNPASALQNRIRRDVDRAVGRVRNGVALVAHSKPSMAGITPKDVIFKRGKVELWRYRGSAAPSLTPPVLIVPPPINRTYVLDLEPGNSLVQHLIQGGADVFLLDWGVPDSADADNTLETYVDEYIAPALQIIKTSCQVEQVHVFGYCFGAVLALLSVSRHPDSVRSLVLVTIPVDFTKIHFLAEVFRKGLDPEDLIDETGNVPAEVVGSAFRALKPIANVAAYKNLLERLWDDKYVAAYQAMSVWARDQIPFPGALLRQVAGMFVAENGLIEGTARLGGRPVDLGAIRAPVLSLIAENDHIVPPAASEPLPKLLTGTSVEEFLTPLGHVSLIVGRSAGKITAPRLVEWFREHSESLEGHH